jgi:hypothetical protein
MLPISATPPILFLVFNRADNTRRTFARIREARPSRLYIHADAARKNKIGEAEKCAEVRAIFDEIDWPCAVFRLFRDENWGVKRGLSDAISWFFRQEKMGIILEDDCLADASFFPFCAELLDKYADDESVMHISGHNWILPSTHSFSTSYIFTKYSIVSAWASWARAWQQLDLEMNGLDDLKESGRFDTFLPSKMARNYLLEKFEKVRAGKIDSWAFPWFFSVANRGGLGIVPRENLVENIGISQADATNTTGTGDPRILKAEKMAFPLVHPTEKKADSAFDMALFYKTHKSRGRLWLRFFLKKMGFV